MSPRTEKICALLQKKLAMLNLDKRAADGAELREEEIATELFNAMLDMDFKKLQDLDENRDSPADDSSFVELDVYEALVERSKIDVENAMDKTPKTPNLTNPSPTDSVTMLARDLERLRKEEKIWEQDREESLLDVHDCQNELLRLESDKDDKALLLDRIRKQIKEKEDEMKQQDPLAFYRSFTAACPPFPSAVAPPSSKMTESSLPDPKTKATESEAQLGGSENLSQAHLREDSRSTPGGQPEDDCSEDELSKSRETTSRSSSVPKVLDGISSSPHSRPLGVHPGFVSPTTSYPHPANAPASYLNSSPASYLNSSPAQFYPTHVLPCYPSILPTWGQSSGRPGCFPIPPISSRSSQPITPYILPNYRRQDYPAQYTESAASSPYW